MNKKSSMTDTCLLTKGDKSKLMLWCVQNHHAEISLILFSPNFSLTLRRVLSTVRTLICSSEAVSLYEPPHATHSAISFSRFASVTFKFITTYLQWLYAYQIVTNSFQK